MKKLLLILGIVVGIGISLFASSGGVDSSKITVTSKTSYTYDAKLPDGTTKQVTSPTVLTTKQIQAQTAAIYDAEQVKLKEIDTKVEALTYKGTIIESKQWVMYGKVISYDYRYKLPDGSSNWINSKVPLKEAEVLPKVKASYKAQLTEELGRMQ
jgi:serine protease inhibitor